MSLAAITSEYTPNAVSHNSPYIPFSSYATDRNISLYTPNAYYHAPTTSVSYVDSLPHTQR